MGQLVNGHSQLDTGDWRAHANHPTLAVSQDISHYFRAQRSVSLDDLADDEATTSE